MEERELIAALKRGSDSAFRQLVEAYGDRIYNTVLGILQDAQEAEDAAQETFMRVHASIAGFREESSLSTWIHRIAVRKALEKIRGRKLRMRLRAFLPAWMPQESAQANSAYMHPGIRAENRAKARALQAAMDALPGNQRLAFTLVQVQGMRYDEACAIMGLGVKAVESLISRAKVNLRKRLEQYKPD